MKLSELSPAVFVFLHCNLGISCVEITLDGFDFQCNQSSNCKITAGKIYQVTGRITLNVGENLTGIFRYQRLCPPSTECYTYDGTGDWKKMYGMSALECRDNFKGRFSGCHSLSDTAYGFYGLLGTYYSSRLCRLRVQLCDKKSEVVTCGPVSNELKVSDIRTVSRYGYDTSEDEKFRLSEKECQNQRQQASQNSVEDKRHPSDDLLVIFGVVLATNMIVFW